MKYARKVKLVDIDSTKPGSSDNSKQLTRAIESLADSNNFSRSYFGSSSITLSQLNNELNTILNRTDRISDDKLKLYNQSLARYLFLQRESEKLVTATQSAVGNNSNSESLTESLNRSVSPHTPTPKPGKTPKYKINIPRVTPKSRILRQKKKL